jgi:uncharacterized protein YndB with AHSA1/START domain
VNFGSLRRGVLVRSDRHYDIEAEPERLWAAMSQVDSYSKWWPWLKRFEAEKLETGAVWRCEVQPPLPYLLRFDVTLEEVTPTSAVAATVSGDIVGQARVELSETAQGSHVVISSALTASNAMLRAMSVLALPIARFGHNWVLDTGARQFTERAL